MTDAPGSRSRRVSDDPTVRVAALTAVFALAIWCLLWRLGRADWNREELGLARDSWEAVHGRAHTNDHPLVGKYVVGLGQVLFGRDVVGVRLLPALCSLLATGVVFSLGRRIGGWWAGIVAAGLWAVLPRELEVGGNVLAVVRADRYALLEPIAATVVLIGLLAGWWWAERPSLRRATVAGAAVGLALATTLLGAVPLLAVIPLALVAVGFRWRLLAHAAVAVTAAAIVVVASYVPFGEDAPSMAREVIEHQMDIADAGQPTVVAGEVWVHQPWWSHVSFWVAGHGPGLALALLVASAASWWACNRVGVAYLWIAVVVSFAVLGAWPIGVAGGWLSWFGPMVVLAGIGVATMAARRGLARWIAVSVLVVFAASGATAVVRVTTIEHGDYGRMAAAVADLGAAPRDAVVLGADVHPYFPGVHSTEVGLTPPDFEADLVVIDRGVAEQSSTATVQRLRRRADELGLVPAVEGAVEYWYSPR